MKNSQCLIAAVALIASVAGAAEPTTAPKYTAAMMAECVQRESARNNTGKSAAEVACKELLEAQRQLQAAPRAESRPADKAAARPANSSASGHSSHGGSTSSSTSSEPASSNEASKNTAPAVPAKP